MNPTQREESVATGASAKIGLVKPYPPGPQPRHASWASGVALLLAPLLLLLGVAAIHDAVVAWGWLNRTALTDSAVAAVTAVTAGQRSLALSILLLIVGGALVFSAARRRRIDTYGLRAETGVYISRADLARLVETDCQVVPGVVALEVRPRSKTLRIEAHTTGGEGIPEQVRDVAEQTISPLRDSLTVDVRVAAGPRRERPARNRKSTS
ncbi:MAG: hypothetical protein ACK5MT_21100 [Actinomycetales bacterium]